MWKKISLYLNLPEMRLFWYFLPLVLFIAVINILYLPPVWTLISIGLLLALGLFIFINNLRLAKSNLQIKIERSELKSVISNLRDGVVAYGPDFKILIFNQAAEQIFNIGAEAVVGQIISPEQAKERRFELLARVIFPSLAATVVRRSEAGVYPQIVEMSFDEPRLDLRVITDRIIDSHGRLLGFIKLIRDRTREVELLRSKGEFITVAAHQLRTPLTGIQWAFESLRKEPLNEPLKEIVETGLRAASEVLRNVNDLLDASKIEEGKFGYNFESVDIASFIEEALANVKDLARQAAVKVYFQKPAEGTITLNVDVQKLSMAFANLLDNAIKYNVQNGEVAVSVEKLKDKPFVQVSVKDTGLGMSSLDVEKLFTKFFRAENAVKSAPGGIGLGLYITKNIIKRHGGDIWAESELNRGTTFYFTLPTDPNLIPAKEIVYSED
jgi:signal transduction histidine kinase